MPIRLRLSLIVTVVASVLVLVGGVAFETVFTRGMHATLEDFLHRSANRLERDVGTGRALLAAPSSWARPVDDQSILQVLRPTGQVAYTTTRAGAAALATAVVRRDAQHGPMFVQRSRPGWHDPRLLLVEPFSSRPRLLVAVGASLDELTNARARLVEVLVIGGPLVVGIVAVGSWLFAGLSLRPVERLREEAMSMSTGEHGGRLAVPRSHDEIARLARTLNELLAMLQGAISHQREFVAVASHELRTPLAVLRAELELARRPGCSEAEVQRSLDVVEARVGGLVRLSDDLLLLASGAAGALRLHVAPVELEALVASSLRSFAATAESRGILLVLDAEPGIVAMADTLRVHQIVDNLVANALDHGSGTPSVEVEVRRSPAGAVLEVRDRGPGFLEEFLPMAFDTFTRGASVVVPRAGFADGSPRRSRQGVGLGLAVVRQLVEAHGGTVSARNRPGGGACIAVMLPCATGVGPLTARVAAADGTVGDDRCPR